MKDSNTLWQPSEKFIEKSNVFKYVNWLNEIYNKSFEIDLKNPLKNVENYTKIWNWSVENNEEFWESIWNFFGIISHKSYSKIIEPKSMPGARWFIDSKLNYAEHVFNQARWGEDAIIYVREDGFRRNISWEKLAKEVSTLSVWLKENGVKKGDRVAAYVSQIPEAVIALLASASIGAIWASFGAELMSRAVIDRLQILEPKVFLFVDGYIYNGKQINKEVDVEKILSEVKSIEKSIFIPSLNKESSIDKSHHWQDVTKSKSYKLSFEHMDFNDPLWILFTSGTTGNPKPVVHSHGGILIETFKGSLHLDLKRDDKFLWYSTPSWMMWNVVVNGLLSGATIVFYDGSPMYKNLLPLWEIAEKEKLTVLGTSAPFIHACMKLGLRPKESFNLENLREIGSTAAPLSPQGFEWVYEYVKDDVWLNPSSGGTDICSGFVGGCPILPLWKGEMQCRWLGVKVNAYDINGNPVYDQMGELVIENPLPSMPIYFWKDNDYSWYRESYFSLFPNVWWHGDWIIITRKGTVIILGRSDSTIKRKGVRIGTLDIYKIVESIPEIQNSLVIELNERITLFVVLKEGINLNEELKQKINNSLRQQLGPYFIADDIIQVKDIPLTLNFKKLEVPIKKILLGWDINKAVNLANVLNPESIYGIVESYKKYIEKS
jgi:acetoacetyl-CoA synthase